MAVGQEAGVIPSPLNMENCLRKIQNFGLKILPLGGNLEKTLNFLSTL